jgi:hypothetical protein
LNFQKLKLYLALKNLGYTNSLFIGINDFIRLNDDLRKVWPSKWSEITVVDCGNQEHMTNLFLWVLEGKDESRSESLINVFKKYKKKLIIFSPQKKPSDLQTKLEISFDYFMI